MNVRRATPADAEAVATAHVRGWQEGYGHVFPDEALAELSIPQRLETWRERIETGSTVFVAERDGDVVGFSTVGPSRDAEGEGELYGIYVRPDAWGTGAGRALIARAEEELRERGYEQATLWVLEDNPRARRFYEAAGWAVDGIEKDDEFLGTRVREVRYRVSLR
ncbi:MAG: GNAT family N-acetyltransferase [Gaiellaceae bacterium]